MDKVIYLTGTIHSSFFLNEINYINERFEETIVISYAKDKKKISKKLEKGKKILHFTVGKNNIKSFFKLSFYKWLFDKNTLLEIKSNCSFSKNGLLKMLYIINYGLYYIEVKEIIDHIVNKNKNKNNNIYLYSYWLTKTAYAISNYNKCRKENIVKIISRAHGYDVYEERNSLNYLPFREYLNSNLDEIHFISEHGYGYFQSKYSNRMNSMKRITRLGTYNPYNLTKKVKKKDRICIASCSNIIPIKRIDLIIDIIANLSIPVLWIHIGTGDQVNEMKAYAIRKINNNKFNFLGHIDNSEILELYKKYDVDYFINMSDSEGVPVSIMEAMSMGIPIIARDVGGNSEIVNEGNGLLIQEVNNISNLVNQIQFELIKRLKNIEDYTKKVNESLLIWDKCYNAEKNYRDFFEEM